MRHPLLQIFAVLLIATLATSSTFAQTVQAEQTKLSKLEESLAEQQISQTQLQQLLDQKDAELNALNGQESPEAKAVEIARQTVAQAQANLTASPSATNEAKLKNERFKLALAERKFKKANAELFATQEQLAETQQQLSESLSATNTLATQIADQRLAVEKARTQAATRTAAQAQIKLEEQQRLNSEQANAEIARLRAELEQKELAEQDRMAQEVLQAEAERLSQQAAAAKTASTQVQPQAPEPNQGSATFLETRQQVTEEELRIQTILADISNVPATSKKLDVIMLRNSTKSKAVALEPLGNELYKVTIKFSNGPSKLEMESLFWEQEFKFAELGGVNCTVIFDNTDSSKPRLIYYPSRYSTL